MSGGFNVETYQLGKQKAANDNYDSIINRLDKLENNQMNIFNEFICDFTEDKYIDAYNTTVIKASNGIIPKQHTENWFDNFENDDNVDWDKCKSIVVNNSSIKLDSTSTTYGEFYTLPISMTKYLGFKFNAEVDIPIIRTLEGQIEFKKGSLWFCHGTDNYGRIWVFRSDTYKYEASVVNLTIYNPDMTIYKESTIPGVNFFGPVTNLYTGYGFSPTHNSAKVIFSEENLCIVGLMLEHALPNGNNDTSSGSSKFNHMKDIVTFVNEDGASVVKYNTRRDMSVYNGNGSSYNMYVTPYEPCRISIQKNKIFFTSATTSRYIYNAGYDLNNRLALVILSPTTGLLNDVNVTVSMYNPTGNYYDNQTATNWCTRVSSDNFEINGTTYSFTSRYIPYITVINLDGLYLSEVKVSDTNVSYAALNTNIIVNKTVSPLTSIYGFGGANGIFYSKKKGYLYIFSNPTNSKVLTITRFEIDWTSKTISAINLKNPISTTINLANTTFYNTFYDHYNEKLKVFDDGEELHLLYGAPNSQTGNQVINYISIDYDLNITQPEIPVHTSDGVVTNNVVNFDMIINDNVKMILYSQGNKDDFTDASKTISDIYSTVLIQKTESTVMFYYCTNTDLTWKNINKGDSVLLGADKSATDIRIKAILQSDSLYDTTPSIRGLSVESWDNNNQESRQSQYCSTRLDCMQNDGKAVLSANQELNDGTIDWYVSFDGGTSYSPTVLNEEFTYTYTKTPDFRVKAVISVTDNAINLPIVHSYTLRTNHMVLHSDLEEVQINLIKTNFKIDTYTNASKNGLLKMTIDTLSTNNNLDIPNSDCLYYPLTGRVGGNFVRTVPETITGGAYTIMLTTDEILDTTKPNSKILYEVSIDGGISFKSITPNIKTQLNNTNSTTDTLILKAIFYDGAQLTAWGWAWD